MRCCTSSNSDDTAGVPPRRWTLLDGVLLLVRCLLGFVVTLSGCAGCVVCSGFMASRAPLEPILMFALIAAGLLVLVFRISPK
jgi:hypothetical protein